MGDETINKPIQLVHIQSELNHNLSNNPEINPMRVFIGVIVVLSFLIGGFYFLAYFNLFEFVFKTIFYFFFFGGLLVLFSKFFKFIFVCFDVFLHL